MLIAIAILQQKRSYLQNKCAFDIEIINYCQEGRTIQNPYLRNRFRCKNIFT